MFKVNNKDTKTTPLASLLLTLNIFHTYLCSSVSIVNFEHLNAGWVKGSNFVFKAVRLSSFIIVFQIWD